MESKWIVLETPVSEERIVGAARFKLRMEHKTSYVDIICADPTANAEIFKYLLLKIEHISFSHGLNKVLIAIPQWRQDIDLLLLNEGYEEQSGHIWPEEKSHEILKPTMILEYHKTLTPKPVVANVSSSASKQASNAYSDGTLLKQMEAASKEEASFGEAKPGMYYNEDGVLCLDFEDDDDNETTDQSTVPKEENMESLIENLFSALHKSFDNNTL